MSPLFVIFSGFASQLETFGVLVGFKAASGGFSRGVFKKSFALSCSVPLLRLFPSCDMTGCNKRC